MCMCFLLSLENQLMLRQFKIKMYFWRSQREENCNIFFELRLPQGVYHKMHFVSDYITLAAGMRKKPHWEIVKNYHEFLWLLSILSFFFFWPENSWFNSIWMSTIKKKIAKPSWANVQTSGENNQRTSYSYVLAWRYIILFDVHIQFNITFYKAKMIRTRKFTSWNIWEESFILSFSLETFHNHDIPGKCRNNTAPILVEIDIWKCLPSVFHVVIGNKTRQSELFVCFAKTASSM